MAAAGTAGGRASRGGGHGGSALVLVAREQEGESELWRGAGGSPSPLDEAGARRHAAEEEDACPAMVGRERAHAVHVAISSSTWRASVWPAWDANWAAFRAKFEHGPKTKYEAHTTLFDFD